MSDTMCAKPLVRRSEFAVVTDPVTGIVARRFGLCGPTATSAALSSALGHEVTIQEVYAWMRENGWTDSSGQFHRWADPSGASVLGGNFAACQNLGATVAEYSGWQGAGWGGWLDFLRRNALAGNPVVFETSRGQALVDSISGLGENAVNLQFHYPCVLGYHSGGPSDFAGGSVLPEGFWVADGCNFAGNNDNAHAFNAANVLQFYTIGVLSAASLAGAIALKGRPTVLDIAQVSDFFVAQADGSWLCKQTGKVLHGGDLDFYRSFDSIAGTLYGFSDMGLPVTNEIAVGSPGKSGAQPTVLVGERCAYGFDPDRVIDNPPGSIGPIYKLHLNHPVVLSVLAPKPSPPSLSFGTPTVERTVDAGEVITTVTQPFTLQ